MINEDKIEWPEIMRVPDYPLLIPSELVEVVGLPPPDGKISLQQDILNIDAIFDNINNNKDKENDKR